jgi:hypothetical protein
MMIWLRFIRLNFGFLSVEFSIIRHEKNPPRRGAKSYYNGQVTFSNFRIVRKVPMAVGAFLDILNSLLGF